MVSGVSAMAARFSVSLMSDRPGPLVAVSTRAPAKLAPMPAARVAISSSNWIAWPPNLGSSRQRYSKMGVAGVIGYPGTKSTFAAMAPRATASLPVTRIWSRSGWRSKWRRISRMCSEA